MSKRTLGQNVKNAPSSSERKPWSVKNLLSNQYQRSPKAVAVSLSSRPMVFRIGTSKLCLLQHFSYFIIPKNQKGTIEHIFHDFGAPELEVYMITSWLL